MAYRGINTVIMMGRLGRDIELKKTQNGKSYCRFSIAVNNNNDSADWFTWVAWNAQAEFLAQYAKKGFGLYLQGYARMEQWDEDGVSRRIQTQTVERVEIVSRTQNPSQNVPNEATEAFPEEEEVLPF